MLLIFKIFFVPIMIMLVSLAGRRWGPAVGGLLGGMPIIVAPITAFLGIERGTDFAVESAKGSLAGVISICLFAFIYAWSSRRLGVASSLVLGISTFLLSTFALSEVEINPTLILFVVGILFVSLLRLMPRSKGEVGVYGVPNQEIGLRMIAASLLVLAITYSSQFLGPKLSGLLAPFPIAGSILSGFTHHYYGHAAAVRLLEGFMKGLLAMAAFAYVFALTAAHYDLLVGLVLGIFSAIALSLGIGACANFTR